ncbi:Fanconi anemia group J protein [Mitosporidium daphniae]|uniref:Fanconi anemia group J protein n=1 Tax=Mitosporidium daphniae TaxID=1485682 RepID=A0A098VNB0_9MICR|nr:Fanconi anemia group J protein [Mitosporidium daphniae]KGG50538.1 Fanconi anemia group J protein [Mitosporidium daphniae]|eukprot:XP_013236981.1 Fanconi anemia group J protein [Mitosporidium daphniae]
MNEDKVKRKREFLPPSSAAKKKSASKLDLLFIPKRPQLGQSKAAKDKSSPKNADEKQEKYYRKQDQQVYTINGISVNFPYKAYACQLNMMDKCANQRKRSSREPDRQWQKPFTFMLGSELAPPSKVPKRRKITHRQITQLVKELGSTSYRPKMAVLGSRNHLCLQNAALNSADPNEKWYLKFLFTSSKEMVKDGACKYYHRADNLAKAMKDTIWDIEDLVENGRDVKGIFWLLKWQGVHIMLPGLLLKRQKLCLHLTITFVTRKSGQQWQSTSRTMSSLLMRPTTLKTPPEKRVAMRWDGSEIQSTIDAAGFSIFYYSDFKKKMERSQELERDLDQKEKEKLSFLSSGAQTVLAGLLFILKFVFEENYQKHLSDYKMALNDYIMGSFASELQTAFGHRLEANHVISPNQVWVGVVPRSPNGLDNEGVYRSLDSFSFQDEMGLAILGYLPLIPHGVLCFVPSYSFLKKAITRWKSTGLFAKLSQIKRVLIELLDEYYESIAASTLQAKKTGKDSGGAILIAVYRGKVSEGLDFIDDNARAVIAIGIPFPSAKDIQITAKKDFNTRYALSKGLLTGSQWCPMTIDFLGRCLRHRNDWGAIILLEKRFVNARNQQQLSKWVRNNVKVYPSYADSTASLSTFMNNWRNFSAKKDELKADDRHQMPKSDNMIHQEIKEMFQMPRLLEEMQENTEEPHCEKDYIQIEDSQCEGIFCAPIETIISDDEGGDKDNAKKGTFVSFF